MESRIQRLISTENLTPTKFADVIGVQRSAISHILSGRNKPSFDLIQKILTKFPRLNADWLMMGRGEMYKSIVQQRLFDTESKPIISENSKKEAEIPHIQINTNELPPIKDSENRINEKTIERVIIFYSDKSFKEYSPNE